MGNGIVTPGLWSAAHNFKFHKAFDDIDFHQKKVLDISCWDGLWSFEAEKRGAAEVYATDIISQRWGGLETFQLAHEALHSKVKYFPDISVFDVREKLKITDFDIVLFMGVYYHLKDPLLALARLRSVMKPGGIIIIEGPVLDGYEEAFAKFYYHDVLHDDVTNWWLPTVPCLREWVECSFFEILKPTDSKRAENTSMLSSVKKVAKRILGREPRGKTSRYIIIAKSVVRQDPKYVMPDEDLKEFCRGQ